MFGLSVLNFVTSDENKTCEIAKSFAKSSPPDNTVSVHCDADKSCAGFHCQGVYLINVSKKKFLFFLSQDIGYISVIHSVNSKFKTFSLFLFDLVEINIG